MKKKIKWLKKRLTCSLYSHDWKYEYAVKKSPTGPGNVYRCSRCGKKDKV